VHYILYSIFYIPYSIKRGFTILEVIVAIFVLTVAVGGSFVLIQQTLIAASLAQSKLAAHYLAQEGIEIVRNIRDTNWLKQRSDELNFFWDTDIIPLELPLGESRDCIADYNDDGLSDFVEEKPLNLDDNMIIRVVNRLMLMNNIKFLKNARKKSQILLDRLFYTKKNLTLK